MECNKLLLSHDYVIKFNACLMKYSGLLAFKGQSLNSSRTNVLLIHSHFCQLLLLCMYIPIASKQIYMGIVDFETIGASVGLTSVYVRFVIISLRRTQIMKLIQLSQNLWMDLKDTEKLIFRKNIQKIKMISYAYIEINLLWIILYLLFEPIRSLLNISNTTTERKLPYPVFIDVQNSPFFEIMYILQALSSFGFAFVVTSFDMAPPFFVTIVYSHFQTLYNRFENVSKKNLLGKNEQIYKDIYAHIVYHQNIIRFCEMIDKFTKPLFLTQLLGSTYNLAIFALVIFSGDQPNLRILPVKLIQMMQLFSSHFIANIIKIESERIAKCVYIVPYTRQEDKKFSTVIQIMMMRSQHPIQLTAGGFIQLSLECFSSTMSNILSFFLVLHTFA